MLLAPQPASADTAQPIYKCFQGADTWTVSSPSVCYKQWGDVVRVYSTWDTGQHGFADMGRIRALANTTTNCNATCLFDQCKSNWWCGVVLGGAVWDLAKKYGLWALAVLLAD
ncbi:hypothetical protein GCM10022215_01390 [Nocardioides fonticola]|uniref:Uncharacterized protein n=1 Tax=Nocardioides fonticola TaxID=450363 RepID=A0ABP7X9G3_9ACTN